MALKARMIENVAVDVCVDPENRYHPQIAAQFVRVPDSVARGWIVDPETDQWRPPVDDAAAYAAPEIVVTAIVADAEHATSTTVVGLREITCLAGATLTISAELRDADGVVIPLNDRFRLPFRSRDGREKVLLAAMVDGVVTINAPIRDSGVWVADEGAINEALPETSRMQFGGITVYVVEA